MRTPVNRPARSAALTGLALVLASLAAGCTTGGTTTYQAPTVAPTDSAQAAEKQRFDDTVQQYMAAHGGRLDAGVRDSLAQAGFAGNAVQVTQSRTAAKHDADLIEVSYLSGGTCFVGQMTSSGAYASTLTKPLASGQCLIITQDAK